MTRTLPLFALLLGWAITPGANALSMGPEEFAAARQMSCVLARESLGQFSDEEYATSTREVLDGFEPSESDVIYAKALGYFDGLMFGVKTDKAHEIDKRLRSFVNSQACTALVSYGQET